MLGVVKDCLSCFFASVTLGQIKSPKLGCQKNKQTNKQTIKKPTIMLVPYKLLLCCCLGNLTRKSYTYVIIHTHTYTSPT